VADFFVTKLKLSQIDDIIRLVYMENKSEIFESYRGPLLSLSYRMLGSLSEAEDVVQDVAISWLEQDASELRNPKSWLIRVCTNKAIDYLKKAYKKREVYSGTWLPDAIPDSLITWETDLERKESLSTSFLILLENLSPKERAVYILRKVFEYSSSETSCFLEISDSSCRKIHERACKKIDERENKYSKNHEKSFELLEEFFSLACSGSKEEITDILHSESEFWSDGGGKASAVSRILYEPVAISVFFANVFSKLPIDSKEYKLEYVFVNSSPGIVLSKIDINLLWNIETIFTFEVKEDRIARIYAQRNPDKLSILNYHLKGQNNHCLGG